MASTQERPRSGWELPPQQREYASLIHSSGRHLIDVVQMLLDMSRLEAGKFELVAEPFAPDLLVEPCLKIVDSMAREKSVRLMTDLVRQLAAHGTPHVLIDASDVAFAAPTLAERLDMVRALALAAGATSQGLISALSAFQSLPHRCILVAEHKGVRWINDSKATNIGATLAAIAGLKPGVSGQLLLIAGGDAKGADLAELQPVLDSAVDTLITLGQDGPALAALKTAAIQVKTLQLLIDNPQFSQKTPEIYSKVILLKGKTNVENRFYQDSLLLIHRCVLHYFWLVFVLILEHHCRC